MTTKIYGTSDDLIEVEGDVSGEGNGGEEPVMLAMSDGTLLEVQYGKGMLAIWRITVLNQGPLFDRIEECTSEESTPYSDVAHFKEGLKWAACGSMERLR